MRFVLHASALEGEEDVLSIIDRLVDRLADEAHKIDVPELELLEQSGWYRMARPTRRKTLMTSVARPPRVATSRGPHVKAVDVTDVESARVADRLAHAPLVIVVEDRESDGVLLDIVVEELGWPELRDVWKNGRKTTPPGTEFDTAGGKGAIPQRVSRAVSDAKQQARPHRLFVICDSDHRWPSDEDPPRIREMIRIRKECAKHDVPCHILWKRNAENYIPDEVFAAVRDLPRNSGRVELFNAFLRRSKAQRDHFPVKDGLTPQERADAITAGLYDSSEEEDLKLLEEPLLPKRPRPLLLLEGERRESFTAEGLRKRDGGGELDALLLALAAEL